MEKNTKNNLILVVTASHVFTWEQLAPGLDGGICVTIKNGNVLVSSLATGLLQKMSAEEYVNEYLGPLLVQNIICSNYYDTWATGRHYNIQKIADVSYDGFEISQIAARLVTLTKACASESIKEPEKIYQLSFDLGEDVFMYNELSKQEEIQSLYECLFFNDNEVKEFVEENTTKFQTIEEFLKGEN